MKAQTRILTATAAAFAFATVASAQNNSQDYSVQLQQAAGALVRAGDALCSYQGHDRHGRFCRVSVRYGSQSLAVEVENDTGLDLATQIPAVSSEITGIEINSNESTLGVRIQTATGTRELHAEFEESASGQTLLHSVYLSRDAKGEVASGDCSGLELTP